MGNPLSTPTRSAESRRPSRIMALVPGGCGVAEPWVFDPPLNGRRGPEASMIDGHTLGLTAGRHGLSIRPV